VGAFKKRKKLLSAVERTTMLALITKLQPISLLPSGKFGETAVLRSVTNATM
jgi:hypothetical protein